jgi:methionyl-tRNA synthetase
LKKDQAKAAALAAACSISLNLFRQLAVYLAPILPRLADQAGALLNAPIRFWDDAEKPLVGNAIAPFERMLDRVDATKIEALIEASKESLPVQNNPAPASGSPPPSSSLESLAAPITFDDFAKVDLRVAKVENAEEVPGAKKILKLSVSLGALGTRTIFAGIKTAYQPSQLIGRNIVVVANLAPRTMSFGTSEGMAVAAGPGGNEIYVLSPDSGAQPGQRVH